MPRELRPALQQLPERRTTDYEETIVTVTSTAGIVSGGFGSAYGASKFALEGWSESLREEVEQFLAHLHVKPRSAVG